MLAQSFAFCLFAAIKIGYELSEREAVEFCAKHIKTYAQVMWS